MPGMLQGTRRRRTRSVVVSCRSGRPERRLSRPPGRSAASRDAARAYDPPAMPDLAPAVHTVIRRCLGVQAGEDVVVVVDPATRAIGEALRDESAAAGADAVLLIMDERATDGTEPPRTVAGALEACDVFIAP